MSIAQRAAKIAEDLAMQHLERRRVQGGTIEIPSLGIMILPDDCPHGCHYQEPYGWVVMADCPLHDQEN